MGDKRVGTFPTQPTTQRLVATAASAATASETPTALSLKPVITERVTSTR
jgi:hypothetical protein